MLYFPNSCAKRTQVVLRLRSDLGVNMAGAALALELLDHIENLQSRLRLADPVVEKSSSNEQVNPDRILISRCSLERKFSLLPDLTRKNDSSLLF